MCFKCVHFNEDEETGEQTCAAFQGPIPVEILQDGFDHRQEFPGDNGVRFTPAGPVDVKWLDGFSS
jgi:hypothetical protein